MTPQQLEQVDIGLMNLLCADGLRGAEKIDIPQIVATLDQWAAKVKQETDRHLYRVSDVRFADHYQHSQARFRAEMLVQVLQEDLGVHYNMDRLEKIDFSNSRDLFIHGLIQDRNGGTCVSMPVLYTAIGRRLGYPVKLVQAKAHLFCRWDGKGPDGKTERFNFDGAGNGGVGFHDDEHYRNWPHAIDAAEVERGEYLKPLSAPEELAVFLAARGHCLLDTGKVHGAQVAYAQAHRLHPEFGDYFGCLVDSVWREMPRQAAAWPSRSGPPPFMAAETQP